MRYNIIGDIHGRTCWKELVKDDCVNIFVGDYLDPYEQIPYEELIHNFVDIIAYKTAHPQTVLLYGNHDYPYLTGIEHYSRYDAVHAEQNRELFRETAHLFAGVASAIGDKALVTHAGVSKEWYEKEFGPYEGTKPSEVAQDINELWAHNKNEFSFYANAESPYDTCGESTTQSPLWIRPWTLVEHNVFAGTPYLQIFGHTQQEDIGMTDGGLICVDCLRQTATSLQV